MRRRTPGQSSAPAEDVGGSPRVLLVGGTPELIRAGRTLERDAALWTRESDTVSDALSRLSETTFDVVVLDSSAETDALEAATAIRDVPASARVPVIVLGNPDDATLRRAAGLGLVDFLDSPVDAARLAARVRFIVDLRRAATGRRRSGGPRRSATAQRDEFLAMLAHELRNPLAAIASASSVMRTPGLESRRDWCLDVIGRQVSQLARLIENLTDASRLTLGRIVLAQQHVDLTRVVRRAVEAATGEIAERHQQVDIAASGGPVWVKGDPARLEQILLNLLINASRYSQPDAHVRVNAARDGSWAIVRVVDEGIGLEPAMLSRIFELFVQAPSAIDRPRGGLGIGLSLARRLAELHGGTLTAHSEGPGRGAEFVVRLPAADAPAHPQVEETASAPGGWHGRRALIVDDNVDAARAIALVLEASGFAVATVHDGASALALVEERPPDLVLMDLGLPVLDGYEVAARIRARPALEGIVLVAMSGYGTERDRRRSAAVGFDHHLVKPVDCAALIELLASRPLQSPRNSKTESSGPVLPRRGQPA